MGVEKLLQDGRRIVRLIAHQSQGDEHQRLSEDDRHHVGCEELQGDVLAGTTILAVADEALSVLHGHLAGCLSEHDRCAHHCIEDDELDDEHHQTATRDGREA